MEIKNAPTLELRCGYSKPTFEGTKTFRYLTVAELKALRSGDTVTFLSRDNRALQAKVNGSPKTWKTRPNDVDVPIKYGLYSYGKASCRDDVFSGETILTEVKP